MSISDKYILDEDNNPIPELDLMKWAKWFETANRIINKTTIGDIIISTVFLGLDHSFGGDIPILWETIIFGGKHDGYQKRYPTYKEALNGHDKAIKLVKSR